MKLLGIIFGIVLFSNLYADNNIKGTNNFVTLGTGVRCDFDVNGGFNLHDVLATTATEIRIDTSINYTGQFIPSQSVYIRGGYASCGDALNGIQSITPTVLDGNFLGTVLSINNNGVYILENIALTNGDAGIANGGGLALNAPDMLMTIERVSIVNNIAANGGGIYKPNNSPALLVIHDSEIKNNTATAANSFGGGIYYASDGELIVYGETEISNNTAANGGGLFLSGTTASFATGTLASTGVSYNKARNNGGGFYLENGTNLLVSGGMVDIPRVGLVGVSGKNYNIIFNEADSNSNNSGSGGGLTSNQSTLNMNAVTISFNKSNSNVGGMQINNSNLTIGRPESSSCLINSGESGCNFMAFNTATSFGGAIQTFRSNVTITATNFNNNRAGVGTVGSFSGGIVNIYSSVLHDNGASGTGGYFDNYVFYLSGIAEVNLIHLTAINNQAKSSFIYNLDAHLKSYANVFYNDTPNFPWLTEGNSTPTAISDFSCQILDNTNNQTDVSKNIDVISASALPSAFVDYVNYDYHILPTSFLNDYTENLCEVNPGNSISPDDIDGEKRTIQRDLGADEYINEVFKDDFE